MRRLAAAETSFPLILTLPLGGGVLRSQVTPRAPEPTPNPSQEGSSNGWPVPLLGEVRGGLISGRFMESLHSLLHMHWDHEPTPNPSQEGNFRAADECLLPSWEGSGVGRFMERNGLRSQARDL